MFEPNRRYEVLEKAISRIRIVFLLWETNKRLKRARFKSKQAIKNRSIFCFAMFVLIFGFGARACFSPRGTAVDVIVSIFIRIRLSTLARKIYGFVFIHFRERFQTYTDSVDPIRVLVWTEGLNVSKSIALVWTGPKFHFEQKTTGIIVYAQDARKSILSHKQAFWNSALPRFCGISEESRNRVQIAEFCLGQALYYNLLSIVLV